MSEIRRVHVYVCGFVSEWMTSAKMTDEWMGAASLAAIDMDGTVPIY